MYAYELWISFVCDWLQNSCFFQGRKAPRFVGIRKQSSSPSYHSTYHHNQTKKTRNIPSWGTNISFSQGMFEDDVPFPVWWDRWNLVPWRVSHNTRPLDLLGFPGLAKVRFKLSSEQSSVRLAGAKRIGNRMDGWMDGWMDDAINQQS